MINQISKKAVRQKKHKRIRKNITGSAEIPRLCAYRSLHHMYAQIIDDSKGVTLISASTMETPLKGTLENTGDIQAANKVGLEIGKKAMEKGITTVVFDRGGAIYHGRVKALAEGAREAGLIF